MMMMVMMTMTADDISMLRTLYHSEYRRNKEEISRENVLLGRKERRYGKEAAARKHDPRSQHHHQRAVGRKVSIKSFVRDVKRGYGPD